MAPRILPAQRGNGIFETVDNVPILLTWTRAENAPTEISASVRCLLQHRRRPLYELVLSTGDDAVGNGYGDRLDTHC